MSTCPVNLQSDSRAYILMTVLVLYLITLSSEAQRKDAGHLSVMFKLIVPCSIKIATEDLRWPVGYIGLEHLDLRDIVT